MLDRCIKENNKMGYSATKLFTELGYWNWECKAHFTACVIRPYENKQRPLHWYNPFSGDEMQAIEITYCDQTWCIYNSDGTGYYKLTKGLGSPRCGHKSFDAGYEMLGYLPKSDMIVMVDEDRITREAAIIDRWGKEKDPAEYARSQALIASMVAFQGMTPLEKVEHIRKNNSGKSKN